MTIPATSRKAGPYTGNSAATEFSFAFKVFDETDIAVYTELGGVSDTAELNVDYSVALNPDQLVSPGGVVTYPLAGDPLASPDKLAIIGAREFKQELSLTTGGAFGAEAIEDALDSVVVQVQQLSELCERAAIISPTSSLTPEEALGDASAAVLAAEAAATAAAASAAALADALPNNPMAFGAVGDGVADDTVAVQAALTAGGWVDISRPHLVSGIMPVYSNTLLSFRPGGELIGGNTTFSLKPTGTLDALHAVGTEPERGDLTLDAGAGNGALYAEGDVIWLQSEEQALEYNEEQGNGTYKIHKKAELAVVASVSGDLLTLQGPLLDDYLSRSASISAIAVGVVNGVAGTVSITTSAAHGLAIGMAVDIAGVLGMTEINGTGWLVYYVSDTVFRVKSSAGVVVDGTAFSAYTSGGTVAFHALTRMAKVNTVDNVYIQTPNIRSSLYNVGAKVPTSSFIYGTFCRNLQVTGGTLRQNNGAGVLFGSCLDSGTDRINVSEMHDVADNPGALGYGVEISGASQNITIDGCRFRKCRHGVTTGTAGSGATPNYGVQRGVAVSGCTAINCTSVSFDTHEDTDSIVFSGCTVIGGQLAGYQARSYDVTFTGCNAFGVRGNGIYLDNSSAKVTITGGSISRCRDTGLVDGLETNRGCGIRSDTGKVTITGTQITECDNFGIHLTGAGGVDANLTGVAVLNCGNNPSSDYAHTAGIYINASLNRLTMTGVSANDSRTTKLQDYGLWLGTFETGAPPVTTPCIGAFSPVSVTGCNFENNAVGPLLDETTALAVPHSAIFASNNPKSMWGGEAYLTTSTGSIAAATQAEVTVALGFTAPSTNYRVEPVVVGTDLELRNITSKTTTQFKIMVYNRGASPQTGSIESTVNVRY